MYVLLFVSSLVNKSYFYGEFLLWREAPFFFVSLWGSQRSNSQSLQSFQSCLLCSLFAQGHLMVGGRFLKAACQPKTIHLSLVLFVVKSAPI